ncbi:MAG: alkaline phosphatase [Fibrobacter sp.]|nr:alkaline phosphatase [Fibrobacter sp.]
MANAQEVFHSGNVLSFYGRMQTDVAEIVAYMPQSKTLFVVGEGKNLEVIDFSDPAHLKKIAAQPLRGEGTSVSVHGELVAVASLAEQNHDTGYVEIFRYSASEKDQLTRVYDFAPCHQPDMLTFTPDGQKVVVACEGSPSSDFKIDPPGGIAIISLNAKPAPKVNVLGFETQDSLSLMVSGVRRVGLAPFHNTLEPEYVTVSGDSKIAWVSLQENNAIAKVNLEKEKIESIFALGSVDHSKPGFGLDAVKDKKIDIRNWPLHGLRQPDGIANFKVGSQYVVLTANEGSPVNDYDRWTDETTVLELYRKGMLDTNVFDEKTIAELKELTVSNSDGCNASQCSQLHTFGGRSISLFDGASGKLLWDSGDQLEQTIAKVASKYFNWNAKKGKAKVDARSSDKGSEPENVTVGKVGGKTYAFVGMERMSGVAVFDLTQYKPGGKEVPKIVDFYFDPSDRGPEGMLFISAEKSPVKGVSLLVVGYEYSKTIVVYRVH